MSKPSKPWNKGRFPGARAPFEPDQVCEIVTELRRQNATHDLCLYTMGIDTMLRCSDLLKLRVEDICDAHGRVVDRFEFGQKKTKNVVAPTLTATTRKACMDWIKASGKVPMDFLFTRGKNDNERHINDDTYRKRVKAWAELIGLVPTTYSTHSLRRTKPKYLYRRGVKIEYISELLGHQNTDTTFRYLGISKEEAQEQALAHDIFKKSLHRLKDVHHRPTLRTSHSRDHCAEHDIFIRQSFDSLSKQLTSLQRQADQQSADIQQILKLLQEGKR